MKKTFQAKLPERFLKLGYQGSNLEMTESESVALPFGDSPIYLHPQPFFVTADVIIHGIL